MVEKDTIVIATTNCEKALFIIAKSAEKYDYIDIQYVDKYAPTMEWILRLLRKGFGWIENDRSTTDVYNNKCRFNMHGECSHKDMNAQIKCKEAIRTECEKYEKRYNNKFRVNVLSIEKAGGIRNM